MMMTVMMISSADTELSMTKSNSLMNSDDGGGGGDDDKIISFCINFIDKN